MRRRVLVGGDHRLTVAVPADERRRVAFGLAVESRRLILGNELVLRVLDDAWICDLLDRCVRKNARSEVMNNMKSQHEMLMT